MRLRLRSSDPASLPFLRSLACMCCFSSKYSSLLLAEKSKEEQQCSAATMDAEAEASSYNCGFLPAARHYQSYGPPPPPPHPAEDGELWEYFPCPFCYIEVEVPFICNHLQEEHCFDTKNAICPICANNIGKEMAAHFRVQHSHLLKRRKPSKPRAWPAAASGKEPYQVNNSYMLNREHQDPAPDPLLSQFICSIDQTESESRDGVSRLLRRHESVSSATSDGQRLNQRVTQLELEERLQRIEFLNEIIMSTIL